MNDSPKCCGREMKWSGYRRGKRPHWRCGGCKRVRFQGDHRRFGAARASKLMEITR